MAEELGLMHDISSFLHQPLTESLLSVHPNQLCSPSFDIPSLWISWWDWAGETQVENNLLPEHASAPTVPKSLVLLRYYLCGSDPNIAGNSCIPYDLRILVDEARRLQISRQTGLARPALCTGNHEANDAKTEHGGSGSDDGPGVAFLSFQDQRLRGMSPKKAHEVLRMTECISRLVSSCTRLGNVRHAVDIGAGQAYLSRQLRDDMSMRVLALDWSDTQTKGAARRDEVSQNTGHPQKAASDPAASAASRPMCGKDLLTYKTTRITADSLLKVTDEWINDQVLGNSIPHLHVCNLDETQSDQEPVPVFLVALHACGSLTPHILRAFLSSCRADDTTRTWVSSAAVIVGCCYNMLDPKDFPLSDALTSSSQTAQVVLTPSHLQLAAQVPSQWLRTEDTLNAAKLAIKKVVWRALLQGMLEKRRAETGSLDMHEGQRETAGAGAGPRRLGRLNNSVYVDWSIFLAQASSKLGVDLAESEGRDMAIESRMEVFHVLRCILGPVVESLILLDRQQYLKEKLQDTEMDVRLVNLFDQASGSGRNVAIVIAPRLAEGVLPWP
ncbi:methyltransferase domain-containing protein [Sparassis latifolia]